VGIIDPVTSRLILGSGSMQIFTHLTANDVQLRPFPFKRELSMEAYLIENEGVLALDRDTFSDVEIIEDELTLKQGGGNQIRDGRIDILATYSQEYIAIVELKLGELKEIHLTQLENYLKQKQQILTKYPDIVPDIPKWIGILVGSSIDSSLANKIINGYQTEGIPIAALTLQRFRSEDGNIFIATDTYFKNTSQGRDFSKYIFNGKTLGKSRLVFEVVKYYVDSHSNTSYSELELVFPKWCQGTRGVFTTVELAQTEAEEKRVRHLLKPEEIIQLADSHIVVTNQWGIGNINHFIKQASTLGYEIALANGNGQPNSYQS
jgi:hypothetical protein